jgi:hypothetical protein
LALTRLGPEVLQEGLAELFGGSLVRRPVAQNPYLWLGIAAGIAFIGVGIARGNRVALIFAMLLGVPLEVPFRRLGNEDRAIRRQARWLAQFSREKPRSHNTAGAHLACGAIAVKKELKALALRRERADQGLVELLRLRKKLARTRSRAGRLVYHCLVAGRPEAAEHSRTEYACANAIADIDATLLLRRLDLQGPIVASFQRAWKEVQEAGLVSDALYQQARVEFEQPPGEPQALLPNGLVRSPAGFLFEYCTFLGRLGLALAFVATFQVTFLLWALVLLALDLYVVEPVVLKLQMSSFGLLLDGPGHKLADLAKHLEALPYGAVFRVPITIPKFSSNPARTNLNAIISGALERCDQRGCAVRSFAMRDRQKQVVIELPEAPQGALEVQASLLCETLRTELEKGHAKFPLATEVSVQGRRVTIELLDEDQAIWDLIGEDASQAFIYLRRNLHALSDTLSYLGERFQPVFILASNTEDPDAIEYELLELGKLQAWSNREYGGQVGFLYLLRGGQWYDYNASLERFDAKDKSFVQACPDFKARLLDPTLPAREALLARLIGTAKAETRLHDTELPGREALLADLIRTARPEQLAAVFNSALADEHFYRHFDGFAFDDLPSVFHPTTETLARLEQQRAGRALPKRELASQNRELLLTVLPLRVSGAFFKKVGNDIAVEELLVTGKTRPTTYTDRRFQEHVQDPTCPNYLRVWGDFAKYTGLVGDNREIQEKILRGEDLVVQSLPEISATLDDKNELAPGEVEKALATMLHSENRHVVIGVPRIRVTLPEHKGTTIASDYILAARGARDTHNENEALTRSRLFSFASPAYGKWFKRPKPYYAHYAYGALNAAHALSHDFQQSYLVAGAGGRLSGFTEALYGPRRFEVQATPEPSSRRATAASARRPELRAKRPLRATFEWVHTLLLGVFRPWRQSRER